jgi:zinc finger protein
MGYVSNIEGVLNRFQDVIEMVGREAILENDDDAVEEISDLMNNVSKIRTGELTVTLEMLDPCGHSLILSEKTNSRPLTSEELGQLPVGPAAGLMETGAAHSRSQSQNEQ